MRIAQLAPLVERVPPPAYGGTEAIVHLLTEELVRRGHEVVLYASGDSQTTAELRAVYPESLRSAPGMTNWAPYEWVHLATALRESGEFDIIHNHMGDMAVAFADLTPTPMLSTLHCLITPETRFVWERYRGAYSTVSHAAKRTVPPLPHARYVGTVYNAIDVPSFPFQTEKEDFLLFLSRISPEKGPHLAIEVARRLGMRLVIAGKVDRVDRDFYQNVIKPLLDPAFVEYVGEVTREEGKDLYRRARCLVLPLLWEEPFGLVMIEAMACGTPVVAFARGAAPEIIVSGQTGFLVHTLDEMLDAVRQVGRIDPRACRRHVETRFSVGQMVDGYLAIYEYLSRDAPRRVPADARPTPNGHRSAASPQPSAISNHEPGGVPSALATDSRGLRADG
jgi:glycosyltransferase involved in cell wall biosynthesis